MPILALYTFVGYRLMPALQQIYGAVTELRFAGPVHNALHTGLMSLQSAHPNPSKDAIALKQDFTLNQIQYRYSNAPQPALKNLSVTNPAKSTVGFVGTTGSGKTPRWI